MHVRSEAQRRARLVALDLLVNAARLLQAGIPPRAACDRAVVEALRAGQCAPGTPEHDACLTEIDTHVRLAHTLTRPCRPSPLVITHGLSGSGKSWLSERLLRVLGAVRLRSDVERQRLARRGELRADTLYSPAAINRTYDTLADLTRIVLECGYPAIVDATFLKHDHRVRFMSLARELAVPFVILSMRAPASVMEARVARRLAEASDASEATLDVLHGQRADLEALDQEEREIAIDVDGETEPDLDALTRRILRGRRAAPLARRLDGPGRDEH